jgi:hypothetical protein
MSTKSDSAEKSLRAPWRCPTCDSPSPKQHPAGSDGIKLCRDPYHHPSAGEIEAREKHASELNS